jgi:cell division protein FtsW
MSEAVATESTVHSSGRPRLTDAIRRTLERPLASYQLVLGTSGLLLGLGLIMVLSASSVWSHYNAGGNPYAIFQKQVAFAVLGLIGAWIATRMPLPVMRRLVTPALILTIALILATFIPGVGLAVNGNQNWLPMPLGLSLQPSEFAKLTVALWIANLYANRKLATTKSIFIPMVPVAGGVSLLVVGQHDLGTALVLFSLVAGMLWVAGLPARYMAAAVSALAVLCLFFVATSAERVNRLLNMFNPAADPQGTGYQAVHGFMGFARGGFWGVGLGGSRQKWGSLPEAHTDFILAVVGEELGLFGSFVVLALFLLFAVAGIRIATRTKDPFARYAAAGIVIWIMAQAVINIGMVLGLLPVIGIPLPLISYGGSSLLVTLVACGILLNCATTEPAARQALEAARAKRRRRAAARKR